MNIIIDFIRMYRFLLLWFLILTLNSCKELCSNQINDYLFEGQTSASPVNDQINIGDTIWFNSNIPEILNYVNINGDSVQQNFADASGLTTDLHFLQLVGQNTYNGAIDSFLFLTVVGNYSPNYLAPQLAKTVSYVEANGSYNISFGLVAQKRGVYCIQILDIFKAEKKCTNATIQVVFSGVDQHLHYLRDIYYGGAPVDPLDSTHSYCFEVH